MYIVYNLGPHPLSALSLCVCCHTNCHLPCITYHLPLITYHLPLITYHLGTYHLSHHLPLRHLPLIAYHLPLITYHITYYLPLTTWALITYCLSSLITYHLQLQWNLKWNKGSQLIMRSCVLLRMLWSSGKNLDGCWVSENLFWMRLKLIMQHKCMNRVMPCWGDGRSVTDLRQRIENLQRPWTTILSTSLICVWNTVFENMQVSSIVGGHVLWGVQYNYDRAYLCTCTGGCSFSCAREEKRREGMQLDFRTVDTKTALCRSGITVFNYWPFKL